jgi:acyl carrier protein
MKDIILNYIKKEFGSQDRSENRRHHYSYCYAPFEKCTCNDLFDVNYDTSLINGGYIDSFSMVVVLVFIENEFDIQVPDALAIPENFDTVNKMVDLIKRIKDKDE